MMSQSLPIRKSPRASRYDYSSVGVYFITICTKGREEFFGRIQDQKMILNEIGNICEAEIYNMVQKRLSIDLHEYVIMPNHVHLLLGVNVWKGNINNMGNTYLDNMAGKSDNMAGNLDNMAGNSDNMAGKSGDMAGNSDDMAGKSDNMAGNSGDMAGKSDNINVVPTLYDTIQTPHHTVGTGFLSEYHNITHQSLGSIIGTRKAGVSRTCHEKGYPFARQSRYHDHIVRNEKEYNAIKHYIRSNPERWKQDTFWRTI